MLADAEREAERPKRLSGGRQGGWHVYPVVAKEPG
jgi:hypothetical protein